jgi:hypothetical protein
MISSRGADLRALAPPLPAIAAAGLLARIAGGSSAGGAGVGVGGGGIAGGLAGKGVTAGLLTKAVAGAVILSGATVGITTAVEQPAAHRHVAPSAPLVHSTAAGTAVGPPATRPTRAPTSEIPGTPSAPHRSNAATEASFGQQTSQAARSAVHGRSALAPRGLTVTRPIITQPPHPTTPTTHAPAAPARSSFGRTVSSARSQVGRTESSQHTSTAQTQVTVPQSARATTRTSPSGLLKRVSHLIG